MKLYWKIEPAPTGRYRSFDKRGWPAAYYDKELNQPAALIQCIDEYKPSNTKTGSHAPLTILIADWYASETAGFKWRKAKQTFPSLDLAKVYVLSLLEARPTFHPTPEEPNPTI